MFFSRSLTLAMQPWLCCEHFTFISQCVCVCECRLCSNREGITNNNKKNNNTNGGISRRSTTMTTTMITWHVYMEKITKKYSKVLYKKNKKNFIKECYDSVRECCCFCGVRSTFVGGEVFVVFFLLFFQ